MHYHPSLTIKACGTLPPLEAETRDNGAPLDHIIAFATATLPKVRAFTWLQYSYRYYNPDAVELFKKWMIMENWEDVLSTVGSQAKAVIYQDKLSAAVERFFPLLTVRRKSTDAP